MRCVLAAPGSHACSAQRLEVAVETLGRACQPRQQLQPSLFAGRVATTVLFTRPNVFSLGLLPLLLLLLVLEQLGFFRFREITRAASLDKRTLRVPGLVLLPRVVRRVPIRQCILTCKAHHSVRRFLCRRCIESRRRKSRGRQRSVCVRPNDTFEGALAR